MILITLAHNWKSAFYTKYSYYIRMMNNIDSNATEKPNKIGNEVKFWLKESVVNNYYNSSDLNSNRLKEVSEEDEDSYAQRTDADHERSTFMHSQ